MNIARYYASIGFQVNTRDVQKVDRALNLVESKLKAFQRRLTTSLSFNLSRFDVNQRRLNIALDNALDIASTRTVFQVSRFSVDQGALNRTLTRSLTEASRVATSSVNVRPNTSSSVARAAATGAVFGGVGLGRLGVAGLALAGGGYGIGALNRRNQEVVSAQLQSQAVVQQAGGTAEQGRESFQYLRAEANRIGFNYLDASGDYNKLLSGLTGSGFSVQQGQKVYSQFAELSRVYKLDKVQQQRVFRALSQVAGKGKLQADELTNQLAESLPGAVSLFARAYQRQTGGNLTGDKAVAALYAATKKGQVSSSVLTYAGDVAREDAAPAIRAASLASQAEQAKYQNTVSDLAVVASDAGVEEGFARIFRTLNSGLSESTGLVQFLASGFNEVTKYTDDLLLFPQSFVRALQGRNSVVADFIGVEATKQLQADWAQIQSSLETISTIGSPVWLPTLESTSRDIAAQFRLIAQLASGDFSGLGENLKNFVFDRYSTLGNAAASGPNLALRAVGTALGTSVPQIGTNGITSFVPKSIEDAYGLGRNPANGDSRTYNLFGNEELGIKEGNGFGLRPAGLDYNLPSSQFNRSFTGNDPSSLFYKDPTTYDQEQRDRVLARQEGGTGNNVTNQVTVQLNVDAATLSVLDIETQAQQLTERFAQGLEQVLAQFPEKE